MPLKLWQSLGTKEQPRANLDRRLLVVAARASKLDVRQRLQQLLQLGVEPATEIGVKHVLAPVVSKVFSTQIELVLCIGAT